MKDKYLFKGEDITTDVLFKLEHIVNILAEKDHIPFDEAHKRFVSSQTYLILKRTDNLFWAESAEFIVDEYHREMILIKINTTSKKEHTKHSTPIFHQKTRRV